MDELKTYFNDIVENDDSKMTSIFRWQQGMELVFDEGGAKKKFRKSCNTKKLDDKFRVNEYGNVERAVLDILDEYGYLNKFNLIRLLNSTLEQKDRMEDYSKVIDKLCVFGAINRYKFVGHEKNNVPHVYTLSAGALSKMEHSHVVKIVRMVVPPAEDAKKVIETLAFNQFHIAFMENYRNVLERYYLSYALHNNNQRWIIDGIYRLRTEKTSSKHMDICVLCLRSHNDWMNKMKKTFELIEKADVIDSPIVLILCEHTMFIKKAERYRQSLKQKDISTFYLVDVSCQNDAPLEQLLSIKSTNEFANLERVKIIL